MKGLSPFIAAIMLIAFTVAIGGIISIFLTGFFKSSTTSVGSSGNALIACAGNSPTVDIVSGNKTAGVFNITYTNPGATGLQNVQGYVTLANSTTFQINNFQGMGTSGTVALNPFASNSTSVSVSGSGNSSVTEVRVVGVCVSTSGNYTLSGSCLSGATCMQITS